MTGDVPVAAMRIQVSLLLLCLAQNCYTDVQNDAILQQILGRQFDANQYWGRPWGRHSEKVKHANAVHVVNSCLQNIGFNEFREIAACLAERLRLQKLSTSHAFDLLSKAGPVEFDIRLNEHGNRSYLMATTAGLHTWYASGTLSTPNLNMQYIREGSLLLSYDWLVMTESTNLQSVRGNITVVSHITADLNYMRSNFTTTSIGIFMSNQQRSDMSLIGENGNLINAREDSQTSVATISQIQLDYAKSTIIHVNTNAVISEVVLTKYSDSTSLKQGTSCDISLHLNVALTEDVGAKVSIETTASESTVTYGNMDAPISHRFSNFTYLNDMVVTIANTSLSSADKLLYHSDLKDGNYQLVQTEDFHYQSSAAVNMTGPELEKIYDFQLSGGMTDIVNMPNSADVNIIIIQENVGVQGSLNLTYAPKSEQEECEVEITVQPV